MARKRHTYGTCSKEGCTKVASYKESKLCKGCYNLRWYYNNREAEMARMLIWRENNPNYQNEWREKNKAKCVEKVARYRAAKKNRTPKWLNEFQLNQIRAIYKKAEEYTNITGIQYSVDHIVPLQGENVSGLHVPWNLRVMTKSANSAKRNR